MISYELAKQLKDAGFPFRFEERLGILTTKDIVEIWGDMFTQFNDEWFYMPTLSDLIEACGDKFKNLYLVRGEWFCNYHKSQWKAEGKTPEEAVAKLWLELNKKL